MKSFTRITAELYGARSQGYEFDLTAVTGINTALYNELAADNGANYLDKRMDSFCDFDGDLYMDENGEPYAVDEMYRNGKMVPLFWHKLVRGSAFYDYSISKCWNGYCIERRSPGSRRPVYLAKVRNNEYTWKTDPISARYYSMAVAEKHLKALKNGAERV